MRGIGYLCTTPRKTRFPLSLVEPNCQKSAYEDLGVGKPQDLPFTSARVVGAGVEAYPVFLDHL